MTDPDTTPTDDDRRREAELIRDLREKAGGPVIRVVGEPVLTVVEAVEGEGEGDSGEEGATRD